MKKIAILALLLTVGCQPQKQTMPVRASYPSATKYDKTIFSRYQNTKNRYTQIQDGAPNDYKSINFIEPVPKNEPFSRYGNPTEYKVLGKKYRVLRSASGYKTRGVASWYGTKFHKQRTSSGEPYDMYIMSAAHKTLPLPSYVKVTNIKNGKTAIVKVNDRGPFHSDRIIDLSYAAAVKLGVYPKGTATVEIETLSSSNREAHYYLQAGAFNSNILAKQLLEKLKHITPSPILIEHYKKHYVVRVGPFGAKNMADSLKKMLVKNGIKGSFSILI